MIFAALNEAAERGELFLEAGGLCRWHRRKDGILVVREIVVLPLHRRLGVGRRLVERVQREAPNATMLARCPAQTRDGRVGEANAFWRHLGFTLTGEKNGINTWQRPAPG